MLTFYPGPAKVYPEVRDYLTMAYDEGILSIPHRSDRFVQLSKSLVTLLRKQLNIPQDYYIYFVSSATECWEIIAQSLTLQKSYHLYNGAFGEKWMEYAKKIKPKVEGQKFDINEELPVSSLDLSDDTELICITQNETSNGTQIKETTILNLFNRYRDKLIAVDATSSMAGVALKYIKADIWFASVQKCFGLPAGLGIMVCSPRTIFRAKEIKEKGHYNSLVTLYERMLNYQTTNTPNVLNLYLLHKVLENRAAIKIIDQTLVKRAQDLYNFFEPFTNFTLLITNPDVRSGTVVALTASEKVIDEIKRNALRNNIMLGNGYGTWAKTSFRIANFPQHTEDEFDILKSFFLSFYS
ncbi:aminotransferase class V-fold PLP-dependent enzyme [Adhaeribacter aquaticus]|uniref:aminotransferase class V-fold PLP-dependent enzyme n=1 Tax=Adhaeribacter aquaticus TaxID=299567 RepID=UPI0003FB5B1A|nr:aminotransferase class V-fold PLP-dependent enzyme [Adhaeribacter aquaticus]